MANFGRGKDKKKRKTRNILGSALKVGAGLATVGALVNQRKNLGNLGNRVINKIKNTVSKNKTTTPVQSNSTQQTDEWKEQFLKKEMDKMNKTNEAIRLRKEAEKVAKRKSNVKRQRSNTNTTNRKLVNEAKIQKDNKTLGSLFDDVDDSASKLDDFDILPSKRKRKLNKSNSKSR